MSSLHPESETITWCPSLRWEMPNHTGSSWQNTSTFPLRQLTEAPTSPPIRQNPEKTQKLHANTLNFVLLTCLQKPLWVSIYSTIEFLLRCFQEIANYNSVIIKSTLFYQARNIQSTNLWQRSTEILHGTPKQLRSSFAHVNDIPWLSWRVSPSEGIPRERDTRKTFTTVLSHWDFNVRGRAVCRRHGDLMITHTIDSPHLPHISTSVGITFQSLWSHSPPKWSIRLPL